MIALPGVIVVALPSCAKAVPPNVLTNNATDPKPKSLRMSILS
jgi:hypothetical protein